LSPSRDAPAHRPGLIPDAVDAAGPLHPRCGEDGQDGRAATRRNEQTCALLLPLSSSCLFGARCIALPQSLPHCASCDRRLVTSWRREGTALRTHRQRKERRTVHRSRSSAREHVHAPRWMWIAAAAAAAAGLRGQAGARPGAADPPSTVQAQPCAEQATARHPDGQTTAFNCDFGASSDSGTQGQRRTERIEKESNNLWRCKQ
jgi:hypothetical protein